MGYQSKTWSLRQLSYVPLMMAGIIIAGTGVVNDSGWVDELMIFIGAAVCGYSLAGMRN